MKDGKSTNFTFSPPRKSQRVSSHSHPDWRSSIGGFRAVDERHISSVRRTNSYWRYPDVCWRQNLTVPLGVIGMRQQSADSVLPRSDYVWIKAQGTKPAAFWWYKSINRPPEKRHAVRWIFSTCSLTEAGASCKGDEEWVIYHVCRCRLLILSSSLRSDFNARW